jgi:hypothetical protein
MMVAMVCLLALGGLLIGEILNSARNQIESERREAAAEYQSYRRQLDEARIGIERIRIETATLGLENDRLRALTIDSLTENRTVLARMERLRDALEGYAAAMRQNLRQAGNRETVGAGGSPADQKPREPSTDLQRPLESMRKAQMYFAKYLELVAAQKAGARDANPQEALRMLDLALSSLGVTETEYKDFGKPQPAH